MFDWIKRLSTTEHERVREDLSAFLDGQLSSRQRSRVEKHLVQCADCRAELESLRQTVSLLHSAPTLKLPRSFLLPASEMRPVRVVRARVGYGYLQAATVVATLLLVLAASGDALLSYQRAQPTLSAFTLRETVPQAQPATQAQGGARGVEGTAMVTEQQPPLASAQATLSPMGQAPAPVQLKTEPIVPTSVAVAQDIPVTQPTAEDIAKDSGQQLPPTVAAAASFGELQPTSKASTQAILPVVKETKPNAVETGDVNVNVTAQRTVTESLYSAPDITMAAVQTATPQWTPTIQEPTRTPEPTFTPVPPTMTPEHTLPPVPPTTSVPTSTAESPTAISEVIQTPMPPILTEVPSGPTPFHSTLASTADNQGQPPAQPMGIWSILSALSSYLSGAERGLALLVAALLVVTLWVRRQQRSV